MVMQGIHDGLRVSSEFLFMASQGLPNHVLLRDGTKRPCAPDEVDHKLFILDDERVKVQVKQTAQKVGVHDKEITSLRDEVAELRALLRDFVGRTAKSR